MHSVKALDLKKKTELKQFACLGKNFILKGFHSFKHLVGINLSSNDHTEVFWSIKLLMVAAHLENIVQYMCQSTQ